jgi:AcrR family transcriptional regulator
MTKTLTHRPTAEERREQVLAAAICEFAEHGYHAARTAAIAERAGISQPYIYALFENKKILFLAVQSLVHDRIRETFAASWRPSESAAETLRALGLGYRALMADTDLLRCQLQGYAASSDPEIREHMRRLYMTTFDGIKAMTGLDDVTVARFVATGTLLNIGAALDVPESYAFAPPIT